MANLFILGASGKDLHNLIGKEKSNIYLGTGREIISFRSLLGTGEMGSI